MRKVNPVTEAEKLAQAFDELKKEIFKTWLGKFTWWTLEKISQTINWVKIKSNKQ